MLDTPPHFSTSVCRRRCFDWLCQEEQLKPVICPASFSNQEWVKKPLFVRQEHFLSSGSLGGGVKASHPHDPRSSPVWTWHFSKLRCLAAKWFPLFRLTSSFVRGNDLPCAEWHLPAQCCCCCLSKKRREKKKYHRCCWNTESWTLLWFYKG